MSHCKPCVAEKSRAYYAVNREKIRWKADLDSPLTAELKWTRGARGRAMRGDPEIVKRNRAVRNKNLMHRRRHAKRHSDLRPSDLRRLLSSRTYCPICRKRMTDERGPHQKHIDHIVPMAIAGTHTLGNVRVICARCNVARPFDGSDLVGHQPTLWAAETSAAKQVALIEQANRSRSATRLKEIKRRGRAECRRIEADLAYLWRLNGASWAEVVNRFGFASAGHAHNVVHGGDKRKYAPARDCHFNHKDLA